MEHSEQTRIVATRVSTLGGMYSHWVLISARDFPCGLLTIQPDLILCSLLLL